MTNQTGEWLRQELKSRGFTPRWLAGEIGVSTQAIYQWFSGKCAPNDVSVFMLSRLLDVPEMTLRRKFGLYIPQSLLDPTLRQRELDELSKE